MIAFVSGWLGERIVAYFIERFEPPELVVVPNNTESAIIQLCQKANITFQVYTPSLQDSLMTGHFDSENWLVNAWSPILFKPQVVKKFHNSLNIHPSYVPWNKGSDCAAWSLREKTPAGVSLITLSETLDAGDVYVQKELPHRFPLRGHELQRQLLTACLEMFQQYWPDIASGKLRPSPQVGAGNYHTRAMTNQDRVRHGREQLTIEDTVNWMLAHDFNDKARAEVIIEGISYELKLDIQEKSV